MKRCIIGFMIVMALIIPVLSAKAESITLDTTYFKQSEYDLDSMAISLAEENNINLTEYDYVFNYYQISTMRHFALTYVPKGYLSSGKIQDPGTSSAVVGYVFNLETTDTIYYYDKTIFSNGIIDLDTVFSSSTISSKTGATEYNQTSSSTGSYTRFIVHANDTVIDTNGNVLYEAASKEFNEILSTHQYSGIEFTFDLPYQSEICYTNTIPTEEYDCMYIDLDYTFKNTDVNGNDEIMAFGIPYLYKEYLYDTGSSNVTKIDTYPLAASGNYNYSGNLHYEYDATVTKIKLIIPFDYLDYSYVHVNFKSNLAISNIKYIERDNSHIGSVDISDKYGVMFIPTQIDDDMLIGFNFHVNGLYSLQLRDTYKSDYNVLSYYSIGYCDDREYNEKVPVICNNGESGYQAYLNFPKGNLEQSVFIVNRNYPEVVENSIVYYDTRYFTYVIYDTPYSTPTIKHPITDEEIVLDDLTDYDDFYTKVVNDNFFKVFTEAFENFKTIIKEIFTNISYFFDNLHMDLQYFFMVIFVFILIIYLAKFLL